MKMDDKIKYAFDQTISGIYLTNCVKNGTMEKEFYDNQLNEFSSGYQSRETEIQKLEQQRKAAVEFMDNNAEVIQVQHIVIEELKQQIEGMKCCGNCSWSIQTTNRFTCCKHIKNPNFVKNCDQWEMKS